MKTVFASLILTGLASAALAAPKENSLDRFLSSALSDFKVSLQAKNRGEFGEGSGMSPIEGVQLRFAQNETIEDRKYTARIKPKGFEQMKLMSALNSNQGRIETLNSQKAVSDALLERYLAASQYLIAFENKRLWTEITSLRTRKLSMLQRAARSSTSSAFDLIEHREKLEEAEVKQGLADSSLRVATAKLKALDSSFTTLTPNASDLPSPVEMQKVLVDAAPKSLSSEIAKEEASRAKNALSYDIAKDTRLIEFVELSYDQFNYGKQVGFRVALNVPGISGSDPSQSEKARKMVMYEVDARTAERDDTIIQTEARESVSRAAELYRSIETLENRPSEVRMRKLVNSQEPLLAVTIQEDGLKRQIRKMEISEKAYESYFNFLASSGILAERSQTNFLSKSLRQLAL